MSKSQQSRQRTPASPQQCAERAKALAKRLRDTCFLGSAMQAMLAAANDDQLLRRSLIGMPEAQGFGLVYDALLVRVVLCLTSLWDPPGDNRASLPTVVRLIKDAAVQRVLRYDAFEWLAVERGRYRRKNALAVGRALRRAVSSYEALSGSTEHIEQLSCLKRLRNEHFAHALVGLPQSTGPRYGWIESLLEDSAFIVTALYFATNGNWDDLQSYREGHHTDAKLFWRALHSGVTIHENAEP